jgi:hypothetical protein
LISSIYNSFENRLPSETGDAIKRLIEKHLKSSKEIIIFFRADDIGVPSNNYSRMMELFLKYKASLCLAVVPSWLTKLRWKTMGYFAQQGKNLFCWHMHGYRHTNHETQGKKFEFGQSRSSKELFNDLLKGYQRLESIMDKSLTPIFTPPWNRCSLETMQVLQKIGIRGISRSYGVKPLPPKGFKDFPIHVDLHTRKEEDARLGWQNLLKELDQAFEYKTCGIMIHHMRMNNQAFIFLEFLLKLFSEYKQIKIITYNNLIQ